jgi:hypothetical protein
MGESIGDPTIRAFHEAEQLGRTAGFITLAILSEKQSDWTRELDQTPTARVMVQPITMRDLRREIHMTFQRQKNAV